MSSEEIQETCRQVNLRGLSATEIEQKIMGQFEDDSHKLMLDCFFDEDPNDMLRSLERQSMNWTFFRVERAHWIIRNFKQHWVSAPMLHRISGANNLDRRVQDRPQ